jgi:hypothetical protein
MMLGGYILSRSLPITVLGLMEGRLVCSPPHELQPAATSYKLRAEDVGQRANDVIIDPRAVFFS